MSNTVWISQIGYLAGHSDFVLGGEGRDAPDDLGTADGFIGIDHIDQG
nr:hypothetical protein [Streptomyces sp. DSM 41633]